MGRLIKAVACVTALFCLTGCRSALLSERGILRGIILDEGQEQTWSVTLCWDSLKEGEGVKWVEAEGESLEEALYKAQGDLEGEPFCGQIQQVLVTDRLTYGQLQEIGELFASPQLALPQVKLAGIEMPWGEQEPQILLETVDKTFGTYGISSNLYEIARRPGCLVLPFLGEQGLGCRVVYRTGSVIHWSQEEAQLALLMAGLSDTVSLEWQDGESLCQVSGQGKCLYGWDEGKVKIYLRLTNARLLGKSAPTSAQENEFSTWLRFTAKAILDQANQEEGDTFLLIPWVKNYNLSLGEKLVQEGRLPPAEINSQVWFSP